MEKKPTKVGDAGNGPWISPTGEAAARIVSTAKNLISNYDADIFGINPNALSKWYADCELLNNDLGKNNPYEKILTRWDPANWDPNGDSDRTLRLAYYGALRSVVGMMSISQPIAKKAEKSALQPTKSDRETSKNGSRTTGAEESTTLKPYQSSVMRRFVKRGDKEVVVFYRERYDALLKEQSGVPKKKGNMRDLKHRANLDAMKETYGYILLNPEKCAKQITDYNKLFDDAEGY